MHHIHKYFQDYYKKNKKSLTENMKNYYNRKKDKEKIEHAIITKQNKTKLVGAKTFCAVESILAEAFFIIN